MTDINQLKGVGAIRADELEDAGYGTLTDIAQTTPENLSVIAGIGLKTAQTLINEAQQLLEEDAENVEDAIDVEIEEEAIEEVVVAEEEVGDIIEDETVEEEAAEEEVEYVEAGDETQLPSMKEQASDIGNKLNNAVNSGGEAFKNAFNQIDYQQTKDVIKENWNNMLERIKR